MTKTTNKIWKLLFVLYALYVVSELFLFTYYFIKTPDEFTTMPYMVYISEFLTLISLVGFYGYISLKKIGNIYFWRALFITVVSIGIYDIATDLTENDTSYCGDFIIICWLIWAIYLIMIPSYIALYLYSFKSKELWSN